MKLGRIAGKLDMRLDRAALRVRDFKAKFAAVALRRKRESQQEEQAKKEGMSHRALVPRVPSYQFEAGAMVTKETRSGAFGERSGLNTSLSRPRALGTGPVLVQPAHLPHFAGGARTE